MHKSVAIIGGGVAGLSSGVFLANEGFNVTLYEASPAAGGRTRSFFDHTINDYIDNGQHIFASWYTNTFDFLKLIGTFDKLFFQKRMEVTFVNQEAESYTLKATTLPPPLHLLKGLLDFKPLSLNDRVAAIRLISSIKSHKISENELKANNVTAFFDKTKQTKRLIDNFWKPFIVAVFNSQPESTSAYLFAEIIKMGFLRAGGSNLVIPEVFLSQLLVDPAVEYLRNKKCSVVLNKGIKRIHIRNKHVTSIIDEDNKEIRSDFYISSVPFFAFRNLLNGSAQEFQKEELSPSPIVNIHMKFNEDIRNIIKKRFYGVLNSSIQWIFRIKFDQICIVISGARDVAEMEKEKVVVLCKNELFNCFPELRQIVLKGARVVKEMRATFVPDKESLKKRPNCITEIDNFYLAGDWTNTGLPSTIESAVKSAKICTEEILNDMKN